VARSRICVVVVAAAMRAAVGCQKITEQSPSAPTPVSLVPLLIPVIGTPTPTPTPPPSGSACSLPPSNPGNPQCRAESQSFVGPVDQSITRVTALYPNLFNFSDKRCDNCYRVTCYPAVF
jgi:hypothetical protein